MIHRHMLSRTAAGTRPRLLLLIAVLTATLVFILWRNLSAVRDAASADAADPRWATDRTAQFQREPSHPRPQPPPPLLPEDDDIDDSARPPDLVVRCYKRPHRLECRHESAPASPRAPPLPPPAPPVAVVYDHPQVALLIPSVADRAASVSWPALRDMWSSALVAPLLYSLRETEVVISSSMSDTQRTIPRRRHTTPGVSSDMIAVDDRRRQQFRDYLTVLGDLREHRCFGLPFWMIAEDDMSPCPGLFHEQMPVVLARAQELARQKGELFGSLRVSIGANGVLLRCSDLTDTPLLRHLERVYNDPNPDRWAVDWALDLWMFDLGRTMSVFHVNTMRHGHLPSSLWDNSSRALALRNLAVARCGETLTWFAPLPESQFDSLRCRGELFSPCSPLTDTCPFFDPAVDDHKSILLGAQGESCSSACARHSLTCLDDDLSLVNSCACGEHFGTTRCVHSVGIELPMLHDQQYFVQQLPRLLSCGVSWSEAIRACVCDSRQPPACPIGPEVLTTGVWGESCDAVCARTGRVCDVAQIRQANTCACAPGGVWCRRTGGQALPATVRTSDDKLMFLTGLADGDLDEAIVEDRVTCDSAAPDALRVCACVPSPPPQY